MSDPERRRANEQEFHDRLFSDDARQWLGGVNRLQASARAHLDELVRSGDPPRVAVEIGVGRVSRLEDPQLLRGGFGVAVDISAVGLTRARAGSGGSVAFVRADAQMLPLRTGTADLVVGTSIVHHLEIAPTGVELARVLARRGRVVLLEPRRGSPLLQIFRRLTPRFRSPDERPLTPADVESLGAPFAGVARRDFALVTQLLAPLLRLGRAGGVVDLFDRLDRRILRMIPPLRRWAWILVLELSAPRSSPGCERTE